MLATAIKNSIREAKEQGKLEGRLESKLEVKLEIVKKMLSRNYPLEEIAELTGLPLEEIKKIQ